MRKLFTIFLLLLSNIYFAQNAGIFQTYIIIDNNGGGDSYYAGGINSDGATSFNGLNLGSHSMLTTLVINGGEIKTYKNNGGDVTGAKLDYRVYKQGATPGSFTELDLPWAQDLGGGDQKWTQTSAGIDALSGVNESGTWELEVYWRITTSLGDKFDNNGGSNFIATFTYDAALPVELSSFTAIVAQNEVQLNWKTATEVNNYGFEVQRASASSNSDFAAATWQKIAFVEGHGNSNSVKSYSYTDNKVADGKYYYRLKQINSDGTFEYSETISAVVGIAEEYSLLQNYPNPFNPTTTIQFNLPENSVVSLKVFNALGQQVADLANGLFEAGIHKINFNASELNSGIYFYQIKTNNFTQVRKMMLVK